MDNYRVTITSLNNYHGSPWVGYFETEQQAQDWLAKQKLLEGRLPERTLTEPVLDENGQEQYNEIPRLDESGNPVYRIEYQYDEEGEVIEGSEVVTDEQIIDYKLITQEVTYPAQATYQIEDITDQALREKKLQDLKRVAAKQKEVRELCSSIIDLVGKNNTDRDLSTAQKDSLMSDTSVQLIMTMLQAGRPGKAKELITDYIPDETIITTQDKNKIIDMLDAILLKFY